MSTESKHGEPLFVPRDQLSEDELKEALEHCAQEPIHIPNLIQPHGAMIIARKDNNQIVQVSNNIEDFFGKSPDYFIEKKLNDIFKKDDIESLADIIRNHDLESVKSVRIHIDDNNYDVVTHISGDYKILEFEPEGTSKEIDFKDRIYEDLRDFSTRLQRASDVSDLYDTIVRQVRSYTGFARVKLYQFDEDWNGMIIAESRDEHMPSYLGLNFPASDIPEQARKLYAKSYLRLIADTRYKPVALHPELIKGENKPIDMSFSILRSVSPIHIQYLENINVNASMSISIMQDGKLWGLIACHHDAPHYIPYRLRIVAETIGHIFSAKLSSMQHAETQQRSAQKSLLIEKISSQINTAVTANDVLYGNHDIAMRALGADGLVIRAGEHLNRFGDIPDDDILEEFINWCRNNLYDHVVYTRDAQKFLQDEGENLDLYGGFLAVPIGIKSKDMAIWFRKPKIEKVKWAGNPEKPFEKTKAGHRLTPRSSFELWQTDTRGKCDVWSEEDIRAAQSIAQIILENEKIHAEQANLAKTEFLSQMSHELRTPLGAVIGIIQILDKDSTLNDKQKELINTLNISASSLLDLINDLLDIAKIESKEIEIEVVSFSIAQILEDLRSMMKIKAEDKGLALNVNYDRANDTQFLGDAGKIKQILMNLVNNAIKFTEKGFVNVMASFESDDEDKKQVTFEVIDSGIGIDEKKKDAVFNKFVQEDSTITRKYGGTGLGLTITKNLAEILNGSVSLDSKKGMGSKFIVKIPLRVDQKTSNKNKSEIAKNGDESYKDGHERKKILLVEDYEGNIVVALYFLQEEGYEVVIAKNGKEAIQKLDKEDFDLIIMDMQMPVMDGITATMIIKEKQNSGEYKKTPIMGMTANALKEDRQKCLDAGMDDYIAKPLDFEELSDKLKNNLYHYDEP